MIDISLTAALRELCRREVEFILVGGTAAMLNGAPIHTYDIDVVHRREPANLERILAFFEDSGAIFKIQPERKLRPNMSHLAARGHINLITRYGRIDFLSTVGNDLDYEALLPQSHAIKVDDGLELQVLNLETIISLKEELRGEKDLAVLPILRAALREKQNKS
jgi:predicted nucleotidyltransferase